DPLLAPPTAVVSPAVLELERGILGACFQDPAVLPEILPLVLACPASLFSKDVHRDVVDWIRATVEAGDQPAPARLHVELERLGHANAATVVAALIEDGQLVVPSNLRGYIRDLRSAAVKRLLAERGRMLTLDAARNGDGPSAAVLLGDIDSIRDEAA